MGELEWYSEETLVLVGKTYQVKFCFKNCIIAIFLNPFITLPLIVVEFDWQGWKCEFQAVSHIVRQSHDKADILVL